MGILARSTKVQITQQHMGQGARRIGDRVDIEIYRAGDMRFRIFNTGIAIFRRQIPRAIDYLEVRFRGMPGQPFGRNQSIVPDIRHFSFIPCPIARDRRQI